MIVEKILRYLRQVVDCSKPVAIACSGGVDSMFLAYVASLLGCEVHVLIVNHNLQSSSCDVSKQTAKIVQKWGILPVILEWNHDKIETGIEEKARRARYALIYDYCNKKGIDAVLLGHHIDDKIETFFMQSVRGVALRGLCSMREKVVFGGINFIRPMLYLLEKHEIYQEMRRLNLHWFEDETNRDTMFTRNWFRHKLELTSLQKKGILHTVQNVENSFEAMRKVAMAGICYEKFGVFSFDGQSQVDMYLFEVIQCVMPFRFVEIRRSHVNNFCKWVKSNLPKTTLCGVVFEKKDGKIFAMPEFKKLHTVNVTDTTIWNDICKVSVNIPCKIVPLGLVSFSVKKQFNIHEKFHHIAHLPVFMQGENILAIPHLQIHCVKEFDLTIS